MRKRYLRKHRSCGVCHPNKVGRDVRWKRKDLERLARWEAERRNWQGKNVLRRRADDT